MSGFENYNNADGERLPGVFIPRKLTSRGLRREQNQAEPKLGELPKRFSARVVTE
jgi:hypothetical protein